MPLAIYSVSLGAELVLCMHHRAVREDVVERNRGRVCLNNCRNMQLAMKLD